MSLISFYSHYFKFLYVLVTEYYWQKKKQKTKEQKKREKEKEKKRKCRKPFKKLGKENKSSSLGTYICL